MGFEYMEKQSKIIELDSFRKKDFFSGEAKCLKCGSVHAAVSETFNDFLECPVCGLSFARFVFPVLREPYWTCQCGNDLFQIVKTDLGAFPHCPRCGKIQYDY